MPTSADTMYPNGPKQNLGNSPSSNYAGYSSAYQEIFEGNEHGRDNLSPLAKDLLHGDAKGANIFPYGSKESREAFINKHGPEKAIAAIEALKGIVDKPDPPGVWSPKEGTLKELQGHIDDILKRQGY